MTPEAVKLGNTSWGATARAPLDSASDPDMRRRAPAGCQGGVRMHCRPPATACAKRVGSRPAASAGRQSPRRLPLRRLPIPGSIYPEYDSLL